MEIHHWIGIGGLVLTAVAAFGALYDRVVTARFVQVRGQFTERDREMKRIWSQVENINARCVDHMENAGGVSADIRNLCERMERVENKIDRLLNGRK